MDTLNSPSRFFFELELYYTWIHVPILPRSQIGLVTSACHWHSIQFVRNKDMIHKIIIRNQKQESHCIQHYTLKIEDC